MNLPIKAVLTTVVTMFIVSGFNATMITAKSIAPQADAFSRLKKDGYQQVRSLKEKSGQLLGYIFVKENPHYTNHVLSSLLVVKARGAKLDTLYQINVHGDFVNSENKTELKNPPDHKYYGFKLYKEKENLEDIFSVGEVDKKGEFFSDDNVFLVDWDYAAKRFVYDPAP